MEEEEGALQGVIHMVGSAVSPLVERYAGWSARSSYCLPEPSSADPGRVADRPLVLLVTGTMIVSDFFDVMADRLEREGFRPVVFQFPDLLSKSLEAGARNIDTAVRSILSTTGEEKLLIIAECNGGIASRFWLERLGGDRFVDRLITFVSAHHGTEAVGVTWCSSLADIKPGSVFLQKMQNSRPAEGDTRVISIYMSRDEIMKPYTTSKIDGALNIEVCDEDLERRAEERKPYPVHHLVGSILMRYCPIHLAGFFDGPFHDLLVSCLRDDPEVIRSFNELDIRVD